MKKLIAFCFLIILSIGCSNRAPWPELTLSETSPDGNFTVKIIEKVYNTADRQFKVVLVNKSGLEKVLFESVTIFL